MSLDNMKKRMIFDGGGSSDGRNVRGKYLSFLSSLNNSYQAENITFKDNQWRCLINPDKLNNDYDQKEISIDFKAHMKDGDVFYWNRTKSYWMAYLQHYEEEAYYRATIRKCNNYIDIDGHRYWVYMRGPVETALIWKQKHQIEMNDLNYSLMFYVTKNDETLEYFKRFQIVKFGYKEGELHNWRVAATDKYSQDGIIEVYVEEYFDNEMEDSSVKDIEIKPNLKEPCIVGPQFVKPYDIVTYQVKNIKDGKFVINSNKAKIDSFEDISCTLRITTGRSSKEPIELKYITNDNEVILPITIKSL